MNNLCRMEALTGRSTSKKVKLNQWTMDNLTLWLEFLKSAKECIPINRVIFRKPTLTTFSDSSEIGIGGFCPQICILWHHFFHRGGSKGLHTEYERRHHIDNHHGDLSRARPKPQPIPLHHQQEWHHEHSWGLRKSNHDLEDAPIHNEVARYHAQNSMRRNACNYSQHLLGRLDIIADCLSWDRHLSKNQLIAVFTSLHPLYPPIKWSLSTSPKNIPCGLHRWR